MKIALAQISVVQGDVSKNLQKVKNFAMQAKANNVDIIMFPEMFVCGFNYKKNNEYIQAHQNELIFELSNIAKTNNLYLCGSTPHLINPTKPPTNRMHLFDNSGNEIAHYDKLHLFSVFNEHRHCSAGNKITVVETPLGQIGLAICYDLRFPRLFETMAEMGANIVLLSAGWPYPRSEHWQILTKARAIENQFFVVAVNQCGTECFGEKKIEYFGLSQAIDPWGNVIAQCNKDIPDSLAFADINLQDVIDVRKKIPVHTDKRNDIYLT